MKILDSFNEQYARQSQISMSVEEYLDLCKVDPSAYASPSQRMLNAIGDPELVDTSKDPRLSRIYSNAIIRVYKPFKNFFGIELSIMRLVDYYIHAAQGLEESRQICYLKGPVASAKSSLAEVQKRLFETQPFYIIQGSPVNDSPLSLFDKETFGDQLLTEYGIPKHRLRVRPSGWLTKRLDELNGDISKLRVVKVYPSINHQLGIAVVEAGDPNNQDVSVLSGKTNIRKIGEYDQHDPDCYNYNGGLNRSNQGLLEFREMFKADIKVLNPLLFATQDGLYTGTEPVGGMPYEGIVLAHSNETEWQTFKNNKANEALLDRVYLIDVPYNLRIDEEVNIYNKELSNSELVKAACAPHTKEMLAKFCVMSRLIVPHNSKLATKARIYNGESLKHKDTEAVSLEQYKTEAGIDEGMEGLSTRFAFKVLSKAFNFDSEEIAADPIGLMWVIENALKQERYGKDKEDKLLAILHVELKDRYTYLLGKELQRAYIENRNDIGQNMFDHYVLCADMRIQEQDFRDPSTGLLLDQNALETELQKLEKGANIANVTSFRNEIVTFCLRARDKNGGKNPNWTSYEKIKEVIEKRMFVTIEEMLPIISFDKKRDKQEEKKHTSFVQRMKEKGYTEKQIRRVVDYYIRARNSK